MTIGRAENDGRGSDMSQDSTRMPLTGQGQVQDASTSQDVVEAVFTIDGTQLTIEEAKKRCKRMMVAGFFLLPWMWVVNVWYFWPIFREGQHFPDTTMRGMLRISAIGASVCVGAVMVWLVIFVSVPSKGIFYDLDVRRIPKIDL